jgi:hypothetical protein
MFSLVGGLLGFESRSGRSVRPCGTLVIMWIAACVREMCASQDERQDIPSYSGIRAARHAAQMAGCLPMTIMGVGDIVGNEGLEFEERLERVCRETGREVRRVRRRNMRCKMRKVLVVLLSTYKSSRYSTV